MSKKELAIIFFVAVFLVTVILSFFLERLIPDSNWKIVIRLTWYLTCGFTAFIFGKQIRKQLVSGKLICLHCGKYTELLCSDCRIDYQEKIAVCGSVSCDRKHQEYEQWRKHINA